MRGENRRLSKQKEKALRLVSERGERVGIQNDGCAAREARVDEIPGRATYSATRSSNDGVEPLIIEQIGEATCSVKRLDHDRGQGSRVDRHSVDWACNAHEASANAQGTSGGESSGTCCMSGPADDDAMTAIIFMACWIWLRDLPEFGTVLELGRRNNIQRRVWNPNVGNDNLAT